MPGISGFSSFLFPGEGFRESWSLFEGCCCCLGALLTEDAEANSAFALGDFKAFDRIPLEDGTRRVD